MLKQQNLVDAALRSGATKAAIVSRENIHTSESFRAMCASNQCGVYNQCWKCPPEIGEISALIKQIKEYPFGLLYQTVSAIEDSFDLEGMQEAGRAHAQVSLRLQDEIKELLHAEFLHLGSGGCKICEICSKRDHKPCRFPQKAMASMEGYGIDVYKTTKSTHLKYINGPNTVTFFGIVFFSE